MITWKIGNMGRETVEGRAVPVEKLAKKLKDTGIDIADIDLEKAIEYYEEGHRKEKKKLSEIRASLEMP